MGIKAGASNDNPKALPITGLDAKIIGSITDPIVGAAWKERAGNADLASERVFPCRSNADVRAALATILHHSQVQIEIAGGIVRHHHGW